MVHLEWRKTALAPHSFLSRKCREYKFINLDIGFRLPYINEIIRTTNSSVLIVAYRGYSDSEGSPE